MTTTNTTNETKHTFPKRSNLGEPTKEISPRSISESVIKIATRIQELYKEEAKRKVKEH